ncbi:MAG TPA: hypothetical protein VHU40_10270 [Polyangia bacterium]|nr:hypothetical protein [Polyangia bacterium]
MASLLLAGTAAGGAQAWRAARAWRGDGATHGHAIKKKLGLRPRHDLSGEAAPELSVGSSGTFLGMADDLLLDRLRKQKVARLKLNRGGSSLSFRVDFADGSRAAWKPAQTNAQTVPRKEVAAYRLNRLLGLDAVPPAAPRSLSKDELFGALHPETQAFVPRIRAETIIGPSGQIAGEASYWIPVIKDCDLDTPEGHQLMASWLTQNEPIPYERRELAAQVAILTVFDFLIANPDRYSGGNMKTSEDGKKLFFMDNTMSFFLESQGTDKNRANLLRQQRFSRHLHEALALVDVPTLQRLLREPDGTEVLTDAEIRAVVQRREYVQRYVADLIKQHGEAKVLCFP